jgi:hypothetical protein
MRNELVRARKVMEEGRYNDDVAARLPEPREDQLIDMGLMKQCSGGDSVSISALIQEVGSDAYRSRELVKNQVEEKK